MFIVEVGDSLQVIGHLTVAVSLTRLVTPDTVFMWATTGVWVNRIR